MHFVAICCCLLLFAAICCFLLLFAALCCYSMLFAASCCLFLIFVAFCWCWLIFPAVCCSLGCCLLRFCLVCFVLLLLLLLDLKNTSKMTHRALKIRPQRLPKASQNSPKMTLEAPWGPPGGPKSSLFWRESIFEAILDPKMEPKWTPKSTKSLHFLWKSGLSSLFGRMFPALQMFSHLLVKFASIFGRPNPWTPWFFLRKTTIFKKPMIFKRISNKNLWFSGPGRSRPLAPTGPGA